jgi:hypothetical protein
LAVLCVAAVQAEDLAEVVAVELAFAAVADQVQLERAQAVPVVAEHTFASPDVVVPSETAFADVAKESSVVAEQDGPDIPPVQEGYLAHIQGSFALGHADVACEDAYALSEEPLLQDEKAGWQYVAGRGEAVQLSVQADLVEWLPVPALS